jgi:hypothetical protein
MRTSTGSAHARSVLLAASQAQCMLTLYHCRARSVQKLSVQRYAIPCAQDYALRPACSEIDAMCPDRAQCNLWHITLAGRIDGKILARGTRVLILNMPGWQMPDSRLS